MMVRSFSEASLHSFLKEIFLSEVIPVYQGFTVNIDKFDEYHAFRVEHMVIIKGKNDLNPICLSLSKRFTWHGSSVLPTSDKGPLSYNALFSKTDSILRTIDKWREWNE